MRRNDKPRRREREVIEREFNQRWTERHNIERVHRTAATPATPERDVRTCSSPRSTEIQFQIIDDNECTMPARVFLTPVDETISGPA